MYKSKFSKVTILLKSAKKMYRDGSITDDEYLRVLEQIENEFLDVVDKVETDEISKVIFDLIKLG